MLEASGRVLVAHADESYEEWGYSGSLVYGAGRRTASVSQMRVGSTAGAAASGVRNLWMLENASGLVRPGHGGMPLAPTGSTPRSATGSGAEHCGNPYFVADDSGLTRLGLELTAADVLGVGLEFGRREGVDQAPEDAMLLRGGAEVLAAGARGGGYAAGPGGRARGLPEQPLRERSAGGCVQPAPFDARPKSGWRHSPLVRSDTLGSSVASAPVAVPPSWTPLPASMRCTAL